MKRSGLFVSVLIALSPGVAGALGLGELVKQSRLNEPFHATIALINAKADELNTISVKLAPAERFQRAGIARPHFLSQLRFEVVETPRGPDYIKVTSHEPVREPFLSFLIEVNWSKGRLYREYSALFDPPSYRAPMPARAAAFRPPAVRVGRSETRAAAVGRQPPRPAPGRGISAPPPRRPSGELVTRYGDTLWAIAQRARPHAGETIQQYMLALLQHNSQAFFQDNINALKAGAVLRFPDAVQAKQISYAQALALVSQHRSAWEQYRQRAAGASAAQPSGAVSSSGAPAKSSAPGLSADTPAPADDAQLKLASADTTAPAQAGGTTGPSTADLENTKKSLMAAEETVASQKLQLGELNAKVNESDEIIKLLREQLELKDKDLAALQERLAAVQAQVQAEAAARQATAESPPPATSPQPTEEAPGPVPTTPEAAATPGEPAAEPTQPSEAQSGDQQPPTAPPAEAPAAPSLPSEPAPEERAAAPALAPVAPTETPPPGPTTPATPEQPLTDAETPPSPVPTPEPSAETGVVDTVMGLLDSAGQLVPGGVPVLAGGLAVLLLGGAFIALRGRRAPPEAEEALTPTVLKRETARTSVPSGAPAASPPQALAGSAVSAPATFAAPTAAVEREEEDLLAVYLAHSRFDEAERLVKHAIDVDPDQHLHKLRLLEVHYASGNQTAFEEYARVLHGAVGGSGSLWDVAVSMWHAMSPGRPLFSDLAGEAGLRPVASQEFLDLGGVSPIQETGERAIFDIGTGSEAPSGLHIDLSGGSAEHPAKSSLARSLTGQGIFDVTGDEGARVEQAVNPFDAKSEVVDIGTGYAYDVNDVFDITGAVPTGGYAKALGIEPEAEAGDQPGRSSLATAPGEDNRGLGRTLAMDRTAALDGREVETMEGTELDLAGRLGEPAKDELVIDFPGLETMAGRDEAEDLQPSPSSADAAVSELELAPSGEKGIVTSEFDLSDLDFEVLESETSAPVEPLTSAGGEWGLAPPRTGPVPGSDSADLGVTLESTIQDITGTTAAIETAIGNESELDIQLNLAQAYIELGDGESARSILNEIAQQGTAEQRREAADLLEQLG